MAGSPQSSDKLVTVGLFRTSLNLRRLLQVVFNPSVTSESTVNGDQWRHYSFALIHAKSKTWFSAGKQRNIVWKCLHDTELLHSFFYWNSCLVTLKLSTVCGSLNLSTVIQESNSITITHWLSLNTHGTLSLQNTTICFNWKEAIWSLTKKKENKKGKLTESLHLSVK